MKRGGPLRRTPLSPGTKPLKRTGIKRKSSERLKVYNDEFEKAKERIHERSHGLCEARVRGICTGRAAHVHHRKLRSQGGGNEDANLLDLCMGCHTWIHTTGLTLSISGSSEAASYALGLLVHEWESSDEVVVKTDFNPSI